MTVDGNVEYTDDYGNVYYVQYQADKDGYRPQSDLLPKPFFDPAADTWSWSYSDVVKNYL